MSGLLTRSLTAGPDGSSGSTSKHSDALGAALQSHVPGRVEPVNPEKQPMPSGTVHPNIPGRAKREPGMTARKGPKHEARAERVALRRA